MPSVLFVDDDPQYRSALARYFSGRGLAVREARSVDEALMMAAERVPDVVLTDLCFGPPRSLDTSESERLIRTLQAGAATARIPVVAVSGVRPDAETQAKMTLCGVEDFFSKAEVFDNKAAILAALIGSDGRPVDAKALFKEVHGCWPAPGRSSRIKKHVSNLRRKLEELGVSVSSVRGAGYRLEGEGKVKIAPKGPFSSSEA